SVMATLRWLRLDFRLQRFEIVGMLSLVAVLALVTALSAVQLNELQQVHGACYVDGEVGAECLAAFEERALWAEAAHWILRAGWAVPFLFGIVLGVPIVAREIEHRTGALAWSLGRSRRRWLLGRVLPVLAIVLLAAGITGVLADFAASAVNTSTVRDLSHSWLWFDQRGLLVPARAAALLGVGVLVGAVVGRTLPALLVAGAVSWAVFAGTTTAMDTWRITDATDIVWDSADDLESAYVIDVRVRAPDGRLLSFAEADAEQIIPAMFTTPTQEGYEAPPPGYTYGIEVARAVPGAEYPKWVLRESAVWAIVAGVASCLALAAARRWRPA
ncbi:MAG TPA: hypothetical protein VHK28_07550, partial [Candidatus Limnocylindria bacterium]|nr:hypothetical protein [Candidatus Limnocylindria bacterium]